MPVLAARARRKLQGGRRGRERNGDLCQQLLRFPRSLRRVAINTPLTIEAADQEGLSFALV